MALVKIIWHFSTLFKNMTYSRICLTLQTASVFKPVSKSTVFVITVGAFHMGSCIFRRFVYFTLISVSSQKR